MGISSGIGSGLGLGFGLGFWGIAEAVSKKLNNSITKIQINGKYGTGFFMKIEIGGKTTNYLITLNQIISQDQINSKINIDLFYGEFDEEHKTIKLDESIRKIRTFENGAIFIEIIPNDGISKDKFLSPDLNYKQGYEIYKNANVYTLGFNDNYEKKEIFPDKITLVNGSKFSHKLNANLCSLICSIENQFVIGIHKQDNNGIFIGEILDTLQKENDNKINKKPMYTSLKLKEDKISSSDFTSYVSEDKRSPLFIQMTLLQALQTFLDNFSENVKVYKLLKYDFEFVPKNDLNDEEYKFDLDSSKINISEELKESREHRTNIFFIKSSFDLGILFKIHYDKVEINWEKVKEIYDESITEDDKDLYELNEKEIEQEWKKILKEYQVEEICSIRQDKKMIKE